MRLLLSVGLISLAASTLPVAEKAMAEAKPPAAPSAAATAKTPAAPPPAAVPTVAKAHPAKPAARSITPKSYCTFDFDEPLVLQYLAPAGKAVKKGEIVAVFDCTALVAALEWNQTALSMEEKAIKDAAGKIADAQAAAAKALETEKEERMALEAARTRYLEGDAPLAELMLTIALHDAEAAYKQQQERFNARDKLLSEGFIQKVEYENDGIRFEKAGLTLQAAKAKLANFTRFDKPLAIEVHSRKIKDKEAAHAAARLKQEKAIESLKSDEAAAKKRHQAVLTERKALEALLEKTVVHATEDGIFMPGDPAHSKQIVARGCSVENGQIFGFIGK